MQDFESDEVDSEQRPTAVMPRSKHGSPAASPKSATFGSFGKLTSLTSKLKKKFSYSSLSSPQDVKKSRSQLFLKLPPSPRFHASASNVPLSAPAASAKKSFLPTLVQQESSSLRMRLTRSRTTEAIKTIEQLDKERGRSPTPSPGTPYELIQGQRATLAPFYFTRKLKHKPSVAFSIQDEQLLSDGYVDCTPSIGTPQDVMVHQSRPPLISKWTETISTLYHTDISPKSQHAIDLAQSGFPFPMQTADSAHQETLASPGPSKQGNIFTRRDLDQLASIQTTSPSSATRYKAIRRNFEPMPDLIASTSTYQTSSEFIDSELEISLTLRTLEGKNMSWSDVSTVDEGYTADTSMEMLALADESPSKRPTLIAPTKYLVHAGTQSDDVPTRSVAVQTELEMNDRKGSNCTQASTFG